MKQARLIATPLALLLLGWLLWAIFGNIYVIHARPNRAHPGDSDITYAKRQPLAEYLSVVRQREMFRQSVIYMTREAEVVDVLGDLVFLGVIQDGDVLRAFIQNTSSQQSVLYSEGESIGDVTIKEIRHDRVVFDHAGAKLELTQ